MKQLLDQEKTMHREMTTPCMCPPTPSGEQLIQCTKWYNFLCQEKKKKNRKEIFVNTFLTHISVPYTHGYMHQRIEKFSTCNTFACKSVGLFFKSHVLNFSLPGIISEVVGIYLI